MEAVQMGRVGMGQGWWEEEKGGREKKKKRDEEIQIVLVVILFTFPYYINNITLWKLFM